MKSIMLAGIIGIWSTGAMAHSPLDGTTPADDAILSEVPSEVLLDFKGKIRLTRITMTYAEQSGVDLDLDGHDGFISQYAIPLQSMGNGAYIIEWRGLGADGHALNGSFSFTVE
ncbi:MAG: copper resistance CopC family protein [Sulfitobacter sp.]